MTGRVDQRARWNKFLERLWAFSARLDVTASLLFVLVLLSIIGSCIPQLTPEVAANAEQLAAWVATLRMKHGSWADFLVTSGAVQFFRTWVFLLPWGLLFLLTALCVLHRWQAVWHGVKGGTVRCTPTLLREAPHFASIPYTDRTTWDYLRQGLEQEGYRVRVEMNGMGWFLHADRHRLARLATLATHLAVILLLAGMLLSLQTSWREELSIPVGESAIVRHLGLSVHNLAFELVRYPDGSVASYEALIRVQGTQARIRVNEPLVYQGVGFYLSGYVQTQERTAVVLRVTYDPGYGVLVIAGFLMFIGMTVTFNMPFSRVRACRMPDGMLHIGGWTDRRAYGFAPMFEALMKGLIARTNAQAT
ncbi:MAG: cytochrome c biogenesis protein ResB [Anaerolineae bacterium]